MKRFYSIFLLLGVFIGGLISCNEDEKYIPTPPSISIENISGVVACLPGETIELKAKLDNPLETSLVWEQNGEKVSTDSIYCFTSTKEGFFKIILTATNVDGTDSDSLTIKVDSSLFRFSSLKNWTGEGENYSALAIQWVTGNSMLEPADDEVFFIAWGYRWKEEETPTGLDMLKAIAKNDPRLLVVISGSYIVGLGYDGNNDGKFEVKNSSLTITQADFTDGFYEVNGNIDGMKSVDSSDYWMGGLSEAYASYWLGRGDVIPDADEFEYSQMFVAGRFLENLSWDIWTFSPVNSEMVNTPPIPRLIQAAEANE